MSEVVPLRTLGALAEVDCPNVRAPPIAASLGGPIGTHPPLPCFGLFNSPCSSSPPTWAAGGPLGPPPWCCPPASATRCGPAVDAGDDVAGVEGPLACLAFRVRLQSFTPIHRISDDVPSPRSTRIAYTPAVVAHLSMRVRSPVLARHPHPHTPGAALCIPIPARTQGCISSLGGATYTVEGMAPRGPPGPAPGPDLAAASYIDGGGGGEG